MRLSLPLATLCLASALAAADPVVFVVRHAERAGGMAASVGISDAGRCRAERLAGMLADAGVKRIFATDVARTQQTAAPLARRLGIETTVLPAKDTAALVERVRAGAGNALVVGHSNTVPEIVKLLGGGAAPAIEDAEFDRLYVLPLRGAQTTAVLLRYRGCEP